MLGGNGRIFLRAHLHLASLAFSEPASAFTVNIAVAHVLHFRVLHPSRMIPGVFCRWANHAHRPGATLSRRLRNAGAPILRGDNIMRAGWEHREYTTALISRLCFSY